MKNKTSLMTILVCLCLAACSPLQIVSSNYDASVQPTATPSEKITDIPQIVEILNQLAEKNVSMYQKEGWWRRNNTVVSQSGDLHSIDHEEWIQLPQNQSECMIRMDISKDPDSGEVMLWQLQLAEGYLGDIISLRKGESEVIQVDQTACRMTANTTEAGYLAQSLIGTSSEKDSRRNLEFADAWYEEQNGKQVFIVYAGFKTPFEKLISQTEGYSFDLQSGMVIDHFLYMGWQNGSEMGKIETQSRYELWEEMPEDVAAQYDQASKELISFVNGAPDAPTKPEPTTQPIDLESLMEPYTKEKPLTDESQLVAAVEELNRRQTAWIFQPGWLLQKQLYIPGKDFTREQYILVHVTDDNGDCQEQMVYFYKDNVISPWIVRLADGTSGNLYALEQSQALEGNINLKENTLCSLSNGESIFFEGDFLLLNEVDHLRGFIHDIQKGLIKGNFKAWVEDLDNRPVFVLVYHTEIDPSSGGTVMDPSTRELERFTQNDKQLYFDLETGTLARVKDSFTLENSAVVNDGGDLYTWEHFTDLPDELEKAYAQAAEALAAYAQKPMP